MLHAAIARADITPPLGMTMPAYVSRECVAETLDDRLSATLLLLSDGKTSVAIAALDLVFVQESLATELRSVIALAIDTPASHVLINASHTHCAPAIEQFQCDDDPRQEAMRRAHSARLREELRALAERVRDKLVPARLATAVGEAHIGINRRQTEPDGTVLLGQNPSGSVDHEVRVLRIDTLAGEPLAIVFSHGCHTVSMGPKYCGYSPDYPGTARALIESKYCCLSLFLQANAGDINPLGGIGSGTDDLGQKDRLGTILGGEVLKLCAQLYTDTVVGPQAFVPSLARIRLYPRVPVTEERDDTIRVEESLLELPLQDLPSVEEGEAILRRYESELCRKAEAGASFGQMSVARWNRRWAADLVRHARAGKKQSISLPIQAISIGTELAIVAVPGETFSATGLTVKQRSPFRHTLFLGYSNGCASYIPTRDAYPAEGWSISKEYFIPDLIFQGYLLPTALEPASEEMVVARSLELLGVLHGKASGTGSSNRQGSC